MNDSQFSLFENIGKEGQDEPSHERSIQSDTNVPLSSQDDVPRPISLEEMERRFARKFPGPNNMAWLYYNKPEGMTVHEFYQTFKKNR